MDFTSLFSTRIQESFDEDQARILKTFQGRYTSKDATKVTLVNYFKGLPIMYPATILGVERGVIDFDVSPQQAVAISEGRYTLIRSNLFPLAIVAHAQYVNIKKHIVSLTKLGFVEILAEKRTAVRLELDPPAEASIQYGDQVISGLLVDLSTNGAGVAVDRYEEMEYGAELSLKFMLPDPVLLKHTLLVVPATFVDIAGRTAPYRCKLKIKPEKHQEHLISRYSFQRQVEIIRGIKELVD